MIEEAAKLGTTGVAETLHPEDSRFGFATTLPMPETILSTSKLPTKDVPESNKSVKEDEPASSKSISADPSAAEVVVAGRAVDAAWTPPPMAVCRGIENIIDCDYDICTHINVKT